jgi:hypothetical protein
MSELEFDLFIPVISKAGGYDKRPMMNGMGEAVVYMSWSLAEKAGNEYINGAEEGRDMMLEICKVETVQCDESINWAFD